MRWLCALLCAVSLFVPIPALADSLSIGAWSQGDALNATNLNSRHTTIQNWANGNIDSANLKSAAGVKGSQLDLTDGTGRISQSTSVTNSAPILTSAQTWNDAAEVFTGWRLSITNTNSASTSRLLDLQVDSTVIASISRVGQLVLNAQNYASGPRTLMDGAWFNIASATYTDNVTAASGTAPRFIAYAFQRPAVAAANSSVTTTNAATVFIASAPVAGDNMTLTNRYALWVDQGDVRIGGSVTASGTAMISGALQSGTGGAPAGQVYIKSAAAGTIGLVVDTAASPTARVQDWRTNGTSAAYLDLSAAVTQFMLDARDLGNDIAGPQLSINRNTNAGGVGPAPGAIRLFEMDGTEGFLWLGNDGKLRAHTAAPTGSSGAPTVDHMAGSLVGDQTSWWEAKNILRQWDDPTKALETVLATRVFDFRYKESSYLDADNQPAVFTGIVGFDRRDPFLKNVGRQQIPALNEVNGFGYLILSVQALQQQIDDLKARRD